jgi:hypothetical protein
MLKKPFVLDTWQSMERPRIGPSLSVFKKVNEHRAEDCWVPCIMWMYTRTQSLSCEDKKRRRKGGRKMSTVFFFFPFPSSACYNGFRMHARSMISPILFLLLFSKRKSRRKCPLMLMARSPPRSHHRFTTTFLSGSVYQNPGVCPFWLDHQLPADSAGWWGGLECIGTLSI